MVLSTPITEPYVIGVRFYTSLAEKAATLEADAERDARFAANLFDTEHKRRHWELVILQRQQAAMLREFLSVVKVRS